MRNPIKQYYHEHPHLMLTLSVEQASAITGFSPTTINLACDRGEFGKCIPGDAKNGRIPRTELDRWIQNNLFIKPQSE